MPHIVKIRECVRKQREREREREEGEGERRGAVCMEGRNGQSRAEQTSTRVG